MKKHIKLLALGFVAASASAISITNFSTAQFTIDGSGINNFTQISQTTNIQVLGSDLGGSFAGEFGSAVDISGMSNSLELSGIPVGALPSSFFVVTLFDGALTDVGVNSATYVGGSWDDITGAGVTSLAFDSADAGFDFSSVTSMQLSTAGGPTNVFITFTDLSAVPEPSAYAALAGLCALGYVMVRRRK